MGAARAQRPVDVDRHVAELRGRALRAAPELAADDHARRRSRCRSSAAARRVQSARRAEAPLGEHRAVGVVVDEHRQAEALGHHVAERARRGSEGARSLTAHPRARGRSATGSRTRRPRPRRRPRRGPRRTASTMRRRAPPSVPLPRADGCARWWTLRSASTAPASSFVPPRSTPITRPEAMSATIQRHVGATSGAAALHDLPHATAPAEARSRARDRPLDELRGDGQPPAPAAARSGCRGRPPASRGRSGRVVARARRSRWALAPAELGPVPRQRADRAGQGLRRGRGPADRRRLPARLGEHDPRARVRRAPEGLQGAGACRRPEPQRLDHAHARRRRPLARSSRSCATRSCRSPGTAWTRSTPPTRYGGAALSIKTIKEWLGIDINHVVEINFERFPDLIDSMGGITYKGGCVVSKINGGSRNGGYTLRLKKGTHHIDGKQALALARTRHNLCNAREDDRTRARAPAEDPRGDALAAARARARSSACRGSPGTRPRRCAAT